MSEQRQYLSVPFAEKDEAKALGARFDPDAKRWFIPNGHKNPEVFVRWQSSGSAQDIDPPHWMDPREYAPTEDEIQAMLEMMI